MCIPLFTAIMGAPLILVHILVHIILNTIKEALPYIKNTTIMNVLNAIDYAAIPFLWIML